LLWFRLRLRGPSGQFLLALPLLDNSPCELVLHLGPQLALQFLCQCHRAENVFRELFVALRMLGQAAVLVLVENGVVVHISEQQLVRLFALLEALRARFNSLDRGFLQQA
jgi:hypothetical protein